VAPAQGTFFARPFARPGFSANLSAMSRAEHPPRSRDLSRRYDRHFRADDAYRATLPDMQNKDASLIQGANVPIQHVGISGFRLPMLVATRDGKPLPLECTITGSVSLAADRKGINMSRIMRTFYEFKDRVLSHELLEEVLLRYKKDLDCSRARVMVEFRYPILQKSLRSGLEGWQYYRAVLEGTIDDLDRLSTSSTRPLARAPRNSPSTPARNARPTASPTPSAPRPGLSRRSRPAAPFSWRT
jgi:hypothetical protein